MMTCCAALATLSAGADSATGLRLHGNSHHAQAAEHIAGGSTNLEASSKVLAFSPKVDQNLVICNAYSSQKPLEIIQVRTRQSLTKDKALAYKQCQEFSVPLDEGDQLDFKAGGLNVGTFYATGLPKSAASLLLIPHRRSAHAVGITFESHAFAELQSPQIAVIDAYRGTGKSGGAVKIIENMPNADGKAENTRVEEELKFNSVVAVNPGKYEVSLSGTGGDDSRTMPLNAEGAAKYVVMRLGSDSEETKAGQFPQELIVFPNGASRLFSSLGATMISVATVLIGLRGIF